MANTLLTPAGWVEYCPAGVADFRLDRLAGTGSATQPLLAPPGFGTGLPSGSGTVFGAVVGLVSLHAEALSKINNAPRHRSLRIIGILPGWNLGSRTRCRGSSPTADANVGMSWLWRNAPATLLRSGQGEKSGARIRNPFPEPVHPSCRPDTPARGCQWTGSSSL